MARGAGGGPDRTTGPEGGPPDRTPPTRSGSRTTLARDRGATRAGVGATTRSDGAPLPLRPSQCSAAGAPANFGLLWGERARGRPA